jgi:iron complex outermembrane recepter protein
MVTTHRFRKALFPLAPLAASLLCSSHVRAQEVVPVPAAPAASGAKMLDSVSVTGSKQPYRNLSATGATKNDALIKDLPMAVRVINAEVLKDAGVNDLAGALDFGSSISRANNFGGMWDSYAMRGFTGSPDFGSDYMVNGFNSSRGYNGLRDGANTASVEILKGPSSALYGRGEPGGTVNITTKKPLFQPAYTLEGSVGSFNTRRTAADLTGPLSETFAYRLNVAHEKGDSFRDTVEKQHTLVAPSLLWMITPDTTLSYEAEALEQKAPLDRGVVAVNGQLGLIPVSRFLGEPGDGNIAIRSLGHQAFLQHYVNDDWSLQGGVSYRESSLKGLATEAWRWDPVNDGRTLDRQQRRRDFDATDISARFEVLGKAATFGVQHNLLFGTDAYRFEDTRVQARGRSAAFPYTIDIYEPVYGVTQPASLSTIQNTVEKQRSAGYYAQDQLEFTPQWKALAGVRYDKYHQNVLNRNATPNAVTEQDLNATSPRAGLVYQPTTAVSLYVTAAKGFRPNSGIGRLGEAFPPEKSRSYEVGAKYDSADSKYSGTVALYQITKENVLTSDPVDTVFSIAVGEVESKGVELDFSGEVAANLRLTAAYAFTDSRVTKSTAEAASTGMAEGRRFANVPRHSANLFAIYSLPVAGGKASIGGGVSYAGERPGSVDANNDFTLPAYTTVKLVSSYDMSKHLRLSLNVDNLFNRAYYASSYSDLWVFPGTERKVTLTAQYKF